MNDTAVAHLNEAGDPTATLFTNDTAQLAAGEGRLTVRHVAAAPAVDVLAGGSPVITALANPEEAKLDLAAGTVSAAVAATGTTDPVIGPADVEVAEGANTIVYAWGSLEADNLALAVQTVAVAGMHSSPDGVPAGSTGLVATNGPDSGACVWAAVIGGSLLAAVELIWVAVRRRVAAGAER
ncbi:hypothetical protein GCM10023152_21350 [Agromyces bauzanensis]|uniref:DUF4397 domain-containing protein n=1 Tax=Agromyces bauzanensis TaxID=1308924 RepID=A0A917UR37_9MICO|nr:hypothetical protein GCM10011372_15290 [Agromyces bauzanensis]